MSSDKAGPKIAIVGPCGAGKSSLASQLQSLGYDARQIAQEHSYVPAMWQKMTNPDVLIYLEASFEVCTRRKNLSWNEKEFQEQIRRLENSRDRCQVYVHTDELTPEEVVEHVLRRLEDG